MSSARHKKTGNPLDRLTTTQRQDMFITGLCKEVGTACDRFFRRKGIHFQREAEWKPRHRSEAQPSTESE